MSKEYVCSEKTDQLLDLFSNEKILIQLMCASETGIAEKDLIIGMANMAFHLLYEHKKITRDKLMKIQKECLKDSIVELEKKLKGYGG